MITLEDVAKIEINSFCRESSPCQHKTLVTLKDGRTATSLSNSQILSIVSSLEEERVNPTSSEKWRADNVKKHFSKSNSKPVEKVLNKIFSQKND